MSISVPYDIMNAQALECEYHCCQTRPLDFGNCIFRHTLLPEFLAVDSKAFPSWGSPSSACSLLSLAPKHRKSPKWIQSKSLSVSCLNGMSVSRKSTYTGLFAASKWQVAHSKTHFEIGTTSKISMPTLELWLSCFTNPLSMMYLYRNRAEWLIFSLEKSVKHLNNANCKANDQRPPLLYAVDGERRCCNVCGHYTLPNSCRRGLKDLSLLICEERKISKTCNTVFAIESQ